MKLLTYRAEDRERIAVLANSGEALIPIYKVLGTPENMTMTEFIEVHTEQMLGALRGAAAEESSAFAIPVGNVEICAPITRPIHDILCVGVNYASHLEETRRGLKKKDFQRPAHTIYFSKRACRISGPEDQVCLRDDLDPEMDYEVELAVIIGKRAKDLSPEETEDAIFGYSVFNDFSSRTLQRDHKQWLRGKSLDGYTAMGPVILTKDELPYPIEVDVICSVNGEERQHSNTSLLLNGVPGILSDLSGGTTLEPGDIIATGTPSGVAMGMEEPKYLRKGDAVTCKIPEIGELTNYIV